MLTDLAKSLELLAAAVAPKAQVAPERSSTYIGTGFADAWKRLREPRPQDLLAELKGIAYTCAVINASFTAQHRPRLYVVTRAGDREPKCPTRPLDAKALTTLAADTTALQTESNLQRWREVIDHPLLTLLRSPNPYHNGHDLLEHTTLTQEVLGYCYWRIEFDALGAVSALWPLYSHLVKPRRHAGSPRPIDYYEYWIKNPPEQFDPEEIIDFRYPDPKDPYTGGLAPLRGAFEDVVHASKYNATRGAIMDNAAIPGVIISPGEVISEPERRRLEEEWQARFGRARQGSVLVAESNLDVQIIAQQLGDIAALAEARLTKEAIANAFGIPMAFLVSESNRANLVAAREQHIGHTIKPRILRRDARLNQCLVPLFDNSARLLLKTDDPDPRSQEETLKQEDQDLQRGVRTINDIRALRGLAPVEWGKVPWMPLDWAPSDFARRTDYARSSGRNADPDRHQDASKPTGTHQGNT